MLERYERFFRLYIGMVDEYTGNASDKYMRTRRCPGSNKRYGYEMMQKKLNKTDEVKKELYNGFLNMFGIGKGECPYEELFCCHSTEWVEEVKKSVEGDKQ